MEKKTSSLSRVVLFFILRIKEVTIEEEEDLLFWSQDTSSAQLIL